MTGNGKSLKNKIKLSDMEKRNNPKFNVGDWITNGDYIWKIVEIKPLDYMLQSQDGNIVDDTISYVDEQFHLWTIQDAKDGDILTNDYNSTFIFKEEYIAGKPKAYCGIIDGYFFEKVGGCWTNEKCYPATKEQRGILFKKIKEAGYEWDDDMKTLNKIQNEPIFNEGDFVVCKTTKKTYQIESVVLNVSNNKYGYDLTNGGYIASIETHKYHLWTLDDAKDGDILVSQRNKPFIYNGNYNDKFVGAHCGLNFDGEFKLGCGKCLWTDNKNIHPANKEQCDLLSQKMKEAGYQWIDSHIAPLKKEILYKITKCDDIDVSVECNPDDSITLHFDVDDSQCFSFAISKDKAKLILKGIAKYL